MKAILGIRIERKETGEGVMAIAYPSSMSKIKSPKDNYPSYIMTYLHNHWFTLEGWRRVGKLVKEEIEKYGLKEGRDFVVRSSFLSPSLVRFSDKDQIALSCPLLSALKESQEGGFYRSFASSYVKDLYRRKR